MTDYSFLIGAEASESRPLWLLQKFRSLRCSRRRAIFLKRQRSAPSCEDGTAVHFALLEVVVAVKGQKARQVAVRYGNVQSLIAAKGPHRVESIVVCFGINGPQYGWLISRNSDHARVPLTALLAGLIVGSLDVSQQRVIITLQRLVVPCLPSEIPHELKRTDDRYGQSDGRPGKSVCIKYVTNRSRTQQDDQEVEPSGTALQRSAARGVVQRISQNVEPDTVAVGKHFHSFGVGGDGGFGCLGPADLVSVAGWRTPTAPFTVRVGLIGVIGALGGNGLPPSFFSLIEIVLELRLNLRMKVPAGALNACRCRQNIRSRLRHKLGCGGRPSLDHCAAIVERWNGVPA